MWLAALLLWSRATAAAADPGPAHRETSGRSVAGAVVRSREWIIRRGPQREEEFVGDVSYRKGPSLLTSDWALFKHESQTWQARGHVRLKLTLKSGDRVDVSGETAAYDQTTARGHLLGPKGARISFERFPSEGPPDSGTARRLDWEGQQNARLTGQVHVWGPRLELWGDQADYAADHASLTLTGSRPVLHALQPGDWTGAVQADRIVALENPDRLQADGKARGWIRFKDKLEKLAK